MQLLIRSEPTVLPRRLRSGATRTLDDILNAAYLLRMRKRLGTISPHRFIEAQSVRLLDCYRS